MTHNKCDASPRAPPPRAVRASRRAARPARLGRRRAARRAGAVAAADACAVAPRRYFFSGRLEAVRQDPAGGNRTQEYAEPNEEGPHEADVVPLVKIADPVHGAPAFNINPMLLEGIRMGDRFWELAKLTTFGEVVDAIFYEVKYVTPWVPGTHGKRSSGMQSAVRGVSNAGTPGIAYTMLLKLFLLRLTRDQVRSLLRHPDSPYIRAIGFLYLRLGLYDFKELWAWFQPYLGDDDQFFIDGTPATATTIGEFVRRLMTDQAPLAARGHSKKRRPAE